MVNTKVLARFSTDFSHQMQSMSFHFYPMSLKFCEQANSQEQAFLPCSSINVFLGSALFFFKLVLHCMHTKYLAQDCHELYQTLKNVTTTLIVSTLTLQEIPPAAKRLQLHWSEQEMTWTASFTLCAWMIGVQQETLTVHYTFLVLSLAAVPLNQNTSTQEIT